MADIEVTAKIDATQLAKGAKVVKKEVKGVGDTVDREQKRLERGNLRVRRDIERNNSRMGTNAYSRRGPAGGGRSGGGSRSGGGGGRSGGGRGSQGGRGSNQGMAMGVLEASRGIEDFAVAGMRGALNNVPGTLMSFGAGAGLAGGAQIALVAVNEIVKAVEVLMDKGRELRETKMFKGIGKIDFAKFQRDYLDEAIEKAKELEAVFERINKLGDRRRAYNAGDTTVENSQQAVRNAKEIFEMRLRGASKEELITKEMQHQNALQDSKVRQEERQAVVREETLKGLRKDREAQAEINRNLPVDKIAYINKELQMQAARTGAGDGTTAGSQAQKALEARKKTLVGLYFGGEGGLERAMEEVAVAKEKLKLLDEEIKKQYDLIEMEKFQLRVTRRVASDQKTLNRYAAATSIAEGGKKDKKAPFDVLAAMSISTGGLLSSLGSVGMGANEATNAMNLQKQQVTILKSIDKSLKKKLFTAYA